MKYLVQPLSSPTQVPLSIADCFARLQAAHDYLAHYGVHALQQAGQVREIAAWGSLVKRILVRFPQEPRPELIPKDIAQHNLVEVINQCATLERLLDALVWAGSDDSGLNTYVVERCHPTTSSNKAEPEDHDLVLVSHTGNKAKFEVSDVVNPHDTNRKEQKDLISLGVLPPRQTLGGTVWPSGRLFLVVSAEFAVRLQRSHLRKGRTYSYTECKGDGQTRIFEIQPTQMS